MVKLIVCAVGSQIFTVKSGIRFTAHNLAIALTKLYPDRSRDPLLSLLDKRIKGLL
jgi:hypothetical protein